MMWRAMSGGGLIIMVPSVEAEEAMVRKAVKSLKALTGHAPKEWYYGPGESAESDAGAEGIWEDGGGFGLVFGLLC